MSHAPAPSSTPALSGRTALVTGSSRGIGRALADGLLAAGARVVLNGRDTAALEETRAAFASAYGEGRVLARAFDVTDETEVRAQVMPKRGRKGDRVYWKVRRYPGQIGFKVTGHTASGTGWATRAEMIAAIHGALTVELAARSVPDAAPFGGYIPAPDASLGVFSVTGAPAMRIVPPSG
mgnify:CR=1 FL=1